MLHFELIRICPELAFWVEIIEHLPVDCDISWPLVNCWEGTELDIEFYDLTKNGWGKFDLNNCLLVVSYGFTLVVLHSVLLNLMTLLKNDILVLNLSEVLRQHIISLLFES